MDNSTSVGVNTRRRRSLLRRHRGTRSIACRDVHNVYQVSTDGIVLAETTALDGPVSLRMEVLATRPADVPVMVSAQTHVYFARPMPIQHMPRSKIKLHALDTLELDTDHTLAVVDHVLSMHERSKHPSDAHLVGNCALVVDPGRSEDFRQVIPLIDVPSFITVVPDVCCSTYQTT